MAPELIGDMSGAVYWPAAGTAHCGGFAFEKGSAYATRGVALPPYDTAETLNRLEACLERFAPRLLVSLGDSFHDIGWQERMAAGDAARLVSLADRLKPFGCWAITTQHHRPVWRVRLVKALI